MSDREKVNILLVDDQPAKLLSYEAILSDLGENLIQATSARQALEQLLRADIAIVLLDVCMPELDGFDLAAMIREHPRFQETAIIFVSAVLLEEGDHLRGYEMGAVDYVPVPVIPAVLRAKVRIFADLHRKRRELRALNEQLERRVAERTAELEAYAARLGESERRRSLALEAGQMGSWDCDLTRGDCYWDAAQCRIFGVDPATFVPTVESVRPLIDPEDWGALERAARNAANGEASYQGEVRVRRSDGHMRWCVVSAAASYDADGGLVRISGVTIDITDRKEAEEHQTLLAREVDHRARNTLAIVQAIIRLTHAKSPDAFVDVVEGRIQALAQTHKLLAQSSWQGANVRDLAELELAPYRERDNCKVTIEGPDSSVRPDAAQALAIAIHELSTNAAKYGALSTPSGQVAISWRLNPHHLVLEWIESGGPPVRTPEVRGFGTKIINASINGQMDGQASFDWQPQGLRCTISLPHATARKRGVRGELQGDGNVIALRSASERNLLLVEDEATIAMMMRDLLSDMGFLVTGPVATVDDALAAARAHAFHGAVLDVNLRGEMIYPVAELLQARDIPFVFITGYDDVSLDGRFNGIPLVEKPVIRERLEAALAEVLPGAPMQTVAGGQGSAEQKALR